MAFPLVFGLMLQERGQCGVSRGEDIPPTTLGCLDEPKVPCEAGSSVWL